MQVGLWTGVDGADLPPSVSGTTIHGCWVSGYGSAAGTV